MASVAIIHTFLGVEKGVGRDECTFVCNALGDDVMPWLTLHSIKLNLHYWKYYFL